MIGRTAIDATLAALADPARRRAVELLAAGPRPAGDLARALELGAPQMSRHLRTLREAGLVEEARGEGDGRLRVYALRPAPMAELYGWLARSEALWSEELSAFRRRLEAREER